MASDYQICNDITADEATYIQKKVVEFADQFTQPRNYREFGFVLRDGSGQIVGGITAAILWDWLQINYLWVSAELRGNGFGKQLLTHAENEARRQGCNFAKLDTFEFEAREFYEHCGYAVGSQTEDFPKGHTHFHMDKSL